MPPILEIADNSEAGLEDVSAALDARGFDPDDAESLAHAALWLRRLGNNRHFLGDIALAELKDRCRSQRQINGYSPQVIMLCRPKARWFIRANIWPSADEAVVRESGPSAFLYGLAHDHNFSFLTLGYHGPGYHSHYYEYDADRVTGYSGEEVRLKDCGRQRLEPGRIMLYRAHRDIHSQMPPDQLSVSINIMHMHEQQNWRDQYSFDTQKGCISGLLSRHSAHIVLRLAMMSDAENTLDLAEHFARHHPAARMRWNSIAAMAGQIEDNEARHAHYQRWLRQSDSALVRHYCARALE